MRLVGRPPACLVLRKQNPSSRGGAGFIAIYFPGCYREEPRQPPSRWQQPCARRMPPPSTAQHRLPHCPRTSRPQEFRLPCFADLKKGFSTTLLAQVPRAKIGIWAIYRALGQPSQSTALCRPCLSSSPLKVTRLRAQPQRNSGSSPNF